MALFKRRMDPLTATMNIVELFVSGDPGAAQRGIDMIESLTPGDILAGLASFGHTMSGHWKPEQIELIRNEFAAARGTPAVQQAVADGGPLLLIAADADQAIKAMLGALQDVQDHKREALNLVLVETVSAVGRIFNKLDIKLGWK
ncbi:MAG TPA: hypothetical protein VG650_14585 [Mycobacteriales bacterium]|nr:hypothetical protein [Mycobacteriales bacterium]